MSLVEYKVGELCSIKHGWAFAGEFFSDEGDYLLLTPGNAYMSGGIKIRPGKEKFYIGEFPKDYLLKKGDILLILTDLVQEAPLLGGSITIPEDNYFLHNQRLGLVENVNTDLVDRRFLYHLFNSPLYRGQVRGSASGATVRHTAPGRIYDCSVSIPQDLATQKNISCLLDSIDELVENNNVITEKLDEILSSTYQEWFINFKFPNHEQVEFVDGIPEGWLNTPLKQVMSTNPSTLKKGELDEILYVDISSVGQGKIESFTQYHIDDAPGRAKRKVQHGDVIWSCVRPNRKQYALIQNPQTNLIVSTGFTVLRSTKIPFTYLTALAASDNFCGYLTSVAQGAAYPAVTYKDFEDYEFLLPPKSLLDKFHEVVELMYEQMHILQIQNQKLQDLKEILLPRLMSGELDVSKLSSIE